MSRDFLVCWFFHQIASPGPIISGTPGRFRFLLNIHGDIRICNHLRGARYAAESIKRITLWKFLSSHLSCYVKKGASLVHYTKIPLKAVVAFIC